MPYRENEIDSLSRLEQMTQPESKWDLSDNDISAIKWAVDTIKKAPKEVPIDPGPAAPGPKRVIHNTLCTIYGSATAIAAQIILGNLQDAGYIHPQGGKIADAIAEGLAPTVQPATPGGEALVDEKAFQDWSMNTCTHPPLTAKSAPFYWLVWRSALAWERRRAAPPPAVIPLEGAAS